MDIREQKDKRNEQKEKRLRKHKGRKEEESDGTKNKGFIHVNSFDRAE